MSRSSAASKRLFVSSRLRGALGALRELGESRGLVALREALQPAFAAFAVAIVACAAMQPTGSILARVAASIVPALGSMAIVLTVTLAAVLAKAFELDAFALVMGSALAFALAFARVSVTGALALLATVGRSGLLLAMLVAFAIVAVGLIARRLRVAPRAATWIGALTVAVAFALLAWAGIAPGELLYVALQPLGGLGDSYAGLLAIVTVETLLWTIGVHGPALLAAIVTPIYLGLQSQNSSAFAHGNPLPHVVTISTFLFIFPGGAGATLPLVLMMLGSRVQPLRKLAAATLLPSLIGVNEPLMFGLPLIMEPVLGIPFIVAPIVLSTTTYAAFATGLVARPAFYVPSVFPPILSAFLATADWRACVLAAFNIILAAAIYFPFLRIYERHREGRALLQAAAS